MSRGRLAKPCRYAETGIDTGLFWELGATSKMAHCEVTTSVRRGIFAYMSESVERERLQIGKRTSEDSQTASSKDIIIGRKPKFTSNQIGKARKCLAKAKKTRNLSDSYNVSATRFRDWPCNAEGSYDQSAAEV